jgi:hypothetical protein
VASPALRYCATDLSRPVRLLDHRFSLGQEGSSFLRQLHTPTIAFEQHEAKFGFEAANLLTQRRLRDEQPLRRTAEVHLGSNRDEVAQMPQLHVPRVGPVWPHHFGTAMSFMVRIDRDAGPQLGKSRFQVADTCTHSSNGQYALGMHVTK